MQFLYKNHTSISPVKAELVDARKNPVVLHPVFILGITLEGFMCGKVNGV